MLFIKISKNKRRRMLVVLTCFLLAVTAWLFFTLNSKYVYTAKTVMVYRSLPQNRAFIPLQSDTIDLRVEGTGWQLLFARLRVRPNYVHINLSELSTHNFIVLSNQVKAINRELATDQTVIKAIPDTLYFDFSRSYEKKIPVRLVSNLDFSHQFGLSKPIRLRPRFVTVKGPKEILDRLNYWKTDTLKLKGLQNKTVLRIPLERKNLKNINIFPANVEADLTVEEFTEKTIEIPLKVYNNSSFRDVAIYPKKVSVTFLVALSDYNSTGPQSFEAGVDLNEWKNKGHTRLTVKLSKFPGFARLVKISPAMIDFIVQK